MVTVLLLPVIDTALSPAGFSPLPPINCGTMAISASTTGSATNTTHQYFLGKFFDSPAMGGSPASEARAVVMRGEEPLRR